MRKATQSYMCATGHKIHKSHGKDHKKYRGELTFMEQKTTRNSQTRNGETSQDLEIFDVSNESLYCEPMKSNDTYIETFDLLEAGSNAEILSEDNQLIIDALNDMHNGVLNMILPKLMTSQTARSLMSEAAQNEWVIILGHTDGKDFLLNEDDKTIIINDHNLNNDAITRSHYFTNTILLSIVRALRDLNHEFRLGSLDEIFAPENLIIIERMRAADLDVISMLIAWELRIQNYNHLWRHILGSEKSDLAMHFSNMLERTITDKDSQSLLNKALSSTFAQWFSSEERIHLCDHETLEYMDEILLSSQTSNPFGNKILTIYDIETVSYLTNGTCYLQNNACDILNDPFYTGMNDEMNHYHLMHILHDTKVTYVQNVPFSNAELAMRIFPDGMMTPDYEQEEEII